MKSGWKLLVHRPSISPYHFSSKKLVVAPLLFCCLFSARAFQKSSSPSPLLLLSRQSSYSVTNMGPSLSTNLSELGRRVTRSNSIRLFQSNADDQEVPSNTESKKRKAPSTLPNTTRKTRRTTSKGSSSSSAVAVPVTPDDNAKVQASPKKKKKESQTSTTKKATPKGKKSPAAKRALKLPLSTAPPKDWQQIYSLVEELREDRSAPVDTDGSEALPETDKGPETYRFQVLVALMLSSQTKDAVVGETMRALQQHGLTVQNIQETSPERLNELIRKIGFHNNKTKYIKQTVEILLKEYNGDIPPTAKDMMELPGVGPKMAYIVENVAFDKQSGIGVDTHMHRMFNQLKWVKSKNPEQTRVQLESWLPKEYWPSVNLLWVGFGQEVQQFKPKLLRKALDCSRPKDALKLINKLGLDYRKEGEKLGLKEEIESVLKN